MKHQYFISGIGTDIGKTIVSSILVEKLKANYWKPIQSGNLDFTDSDQIQALISNSKSQIFPETYRLKLAASPHKAAHLENIRIDLENFKLHTNRGPLICEGAGGIMVPINSQNTQLDLIQKLNLPTILVSKHYLGSINHTLLSLQILKNRHIKVRGIIFIGQPDPYTEGFIIENEEVELLGRIPILNSITKESIKEAGAFINLNNKN